MKGCTRSYSFAVHSRTYILDKKRTTKVWPWKQGPIKKSRFPLFKDNKPLGPAWHWRAAKLESATAQYRLLVQLRQDKPNFKAWLAVEIEEHWAVIGRLESHHHAGLHVHLQCPDKGIAVDQIDPPDAVTVPHWKRYHRRANDVLSTTQAWELALKFFRAQTGETGQLGL